MPFVDEVDSYNVVYMLMTALGMAMLFAYNSFISSPQYTNNYYKYAADNADAKSEYPHVWANMEAYIVVVNMIPNFFLQIFVLSKYGQRLPLYGRLLVSMSILVLSMFVVVVAPSFKPSETVALVLLLGSVGLSGAATAFFQSSTFGLAAYLPEKFTQGTMLGIGISGTTCGLLQIITKAAAGDADFHQQQQQANLFFGIGIGWMALCFVGVVFMRRIPFLAARVPEFGGDSDFDYKVKLAAGDGSNVFTPDQTAEAPLTDDGDGVPLQAQASMDVSLPRVLKQIWQLMLANFLVYTVSLMVFPGVCTMVNDNSWFGVIIVFLFNLGDTCGRFLCRFHQIWLQRKTLLPLSVARFVFIPLMILCVKPQLIKPEALPNIFIFLTGITNGFVSSLCMIYGPSTPTLQGHERASAGSAMSLSLLGGCSVGSLFGLLVTNMLSK